MGLAVHFRCWHPDALRVHVDVMSRMRGVAPFQELWNRRTTFHVGDEMIAMLSLPDLVTGAPLMRTLQELYRSRSGRTNGEGD
jgi:hypothetical protein